MKFTNIFGDTEVGGYSPDALGDYYKITDMQTDHNYWQEKIVSALQGLSLAHTTDCQIIYGGAVTDGGSGTIDISAGLAMGKDASGNIRLVTIPALTAVSLPTGWNDDRQIWVVGTYEDSLESSTRTHKLALTSYHYIAEDNYLGNADSDDLFVDSDPNSVADTVVCWGSFKMNGTTFAADTGRTDNMGLSLHDTEINEYGIGIGGATADVTYALDVTGGGRVSGDFIAQDTSINEYGIGVNGAVATASYAFKVTGHILTTGGITTGGSGAPLAWKVIEIGTWDMDTTSTKAVTHGITAWQNIRMISIMIRSDTDSTLYNFESFNVGGAEELAQQVSVDSTSITMIRDLDGLFDSNVFDTMGDDGNRGWITVCYEV